MLNSWFMPSNDQVNDQFAKNYLGDITNENLINSFGVKHFKVNNLN